MRRETTKRALTLDQRWRVTEKKVKKSFNTPPEVEGYGGEE